MTKEEVLRIFVEERPSCIASYGYGSGVFKQDGYETGKKPQMDIIFIVDDLKTWHLNNMEQNPHDYCLMGRLHLSLSSIKSIKGKNNITYFSQIKSQDNLFKYGVIEDKDFIKSLKRWDNIFVAGRFHKPVLEISSNDVIRDAISYDREMALMFACLLSDEVTTEVEIYKKLCGLSYMGDTRMLFAENPNKVVNIVNGNYGLLHNIYGLHNYYLEQDGDNIIVNHDAIINSITCWPEGLVDYLAMKDTNLGNVTEVQRNVKEFFVLKNREESMCQTLDGFRTNGLVRSVPYILAKIDKKIRG